MHTICPAYEGSVSTSWYPVIAVLKTTSPSPTDSAPSASPTNALPSSSTRAAVFFWAPCARPAFWAPCARPAFWAPCARPAFWAPCARPAFWAPCARPAFWAPCARPAFLAGNDHCLVDAVVFDHEDLDPFGVRGGDVLPDVVRPDRQLAVSSVDEHRQLDGLRAAKVHQRVHRRACGPAVMDHVVDKDDDLSVDGRHLGLGAMGRLAEVAVIPMLGHVKPADRDGAVFELGQDQRQAPRQDVSLADDADEHDLVRAPIPLHYLVRDARERAADLVRVHH